MDNYELYHHGIKGMKWGVRRSQATLERLSGRVSKQEKQRSEIKREKGVLSSAYRKASKKLYVTKAKREVAEAKISNDRAAVLVKKGSLKFAKYAKKHGTGYYTNGTLREIYGNLRSEDLSAIGILEAKHSANVKLGKKACATALSALATVSTAAMANPKLASRVFKR